MSSGFRWVSFVSNNGTAKAGVISRRFGRRVNVEELVLSRVAIRNVYVSTRATARTCDKQGQTQSREIFPLNMAAPAPV